MSDMTAQVRLSEIDEKRFGMRSAHAEGITAADLPDIVEFCRVNSVVFLIARCITTDLPAAQAMEENGFRLMDTLIYYTRHLVKAPIPEDTNDVQVRPVRSGEERQVEAIAFDAFKGYFGHYHADPYLDRVKCDEVYTDWAARYFSRGGQ